VDGEPKKVSAMNAPEEDLRRQHYEIEKSLASKLPFASRADRKHLYTELYDEMFRSVPFHPMLTNKLSPDARRAAVADLMNLLDELLKPDTHYMEIGPGDCSLAFAVARRVARVDAMDVSEELTRRNDTPTNFHLHITDGICVPVEPESIDVAFSNQLMEHLHPDDALDPMRGICRALRPGGSYLCVTPNRMSGPHDVSKFFDDEATCFHLK
jgi:SAM-dependent methyltransferase